MFPFFPTQFNYARVPHLRRDGDSAAGYPILPIIYPYILLYLPVLLLASWQGKQLYPDLSGSTQHHAKGEKKQTLMPSFRKQYS